jgi:hypothetical protein
MSDRHPVMELISCYDCGKGVSFSAANCPHCGSAEPAGPYRHNRKEARRHRIEDKNDRTLIATTVVLGMLGAFYGLETSSSILGALVAGVCYGFLGVVIGVPLAFAINITRNWR